MTRFEIVGKAYQIETDGYTFYSMTAERATKPAVQELFCETRLGRGPAPGIPEVVAKNYDEKGVAAFRFDAKMPDARAVTSQIFTGRFREQAAGAQFELAVLSIGMTLETTPSSTSRRREAGHRQGSAEFYQFLADWEQQHYDSLQNIFSMVRSDHMAESGFSPF